MNEDISTDGEGTPREPEGRLPLDQVGRVVAMLTKSGVGEIRVKQGDLEITVKAMPEATPPAAPPTAGMAQPDRSAYEAEPAGGHESDVAERNGLHAVRSPVVGTFYRAASPSEEPYVEVGSRVSEGQTLCIVEAMKLMNEIPSDVSGEVVEVLAENAEGVEYDQPLFRIRTVSSE